MCDPNTAPWIRYSAAVIFQGAFKWEAGVEENETFLRHSKYSCTQTEKIMELIRK